MSYGTSGPASDAGQIQFKQTWKKDIEYRGQDSVDVEKIKETAGKAMQQAKDNATHQQFVQHEIDREEQLYGPPKN